MSTQYYRSPVPAYTIAFDLLGSLVFQKVKSIGLVSNCDSYNREILYRLQPDHSLHMIIPLFKQNGNIAQLYPGKINYVDSIYSLPPLDLIIWIDPHRQYKYDLQIYLSRLQKPAYMVILSITRMGRIFFPDRCDFPHLPIKTSLNGKEITHFLTSTGFILKSSYSIQGVSSHFWGFLAAQANRLQFPDLADRWFAILRRETNVTKLPACLSMLRLVFAHRN